MGNDSLLSAYSQWLLASDRADSTIALRLRHMTTLGHVVDLATCEVEDLLGHASLATTQRYLHLDDEAKRRVAAATEIRSPGFVRAA